MKQELLLVFKLFLTDAARQCLTSFRPVYCHVCPVRETVAVLLHAHLTFPRLFIWVVCDHVVFQMVLAVETFITVGALVVAWAGVYETMALQFEFG